MTFLEKLVQGAKDPINLAIGIVVVFCLAMIIWNMVDAFSSDGEEQTQAIMTLVAIIGIAIGSFVLGLRRVQTTKLSLPSFKQV